MVDRVELVEKVRLLERELVRTTHRYKQLRRKHQLHRSEMTGPAADEMRRLLSGHGIDASVLVDFEPSDFLLPTGEVDAGGLLWWLETRKGRDC